MQPKIVTDHSEFYRVLKGDEIRYYPANATNAKADACAFDENGDFDIVRGFAVYDTTVSTSFAVALYATKAEAEAYEPAPVPAKPTGIFQTPGVNGYQFKSKKGSRRP